MERTFRVGVFADLDKAHQAVDDAMAAGVDKQEIMMVVSENQSQESNVHDDMIVHPTSDTERGHVGGAMGGAGGGLIGSLVLYGLTDPSSAADPVESGLWISVIIGAVIGATLGSLFARILPELIRSQLKTSPQGMLGNIGHGYDTRRSMTGGAIGGAVGSIAGTMGSFLLGMPDLWFFFTSGLWAAAASVFVGSLVGGMSARGLAPRAIGRLESLADGEHILVSIDCTHQQDRATMIEELLRRDGASMVKPA
jgi:hypothetical protein